MTEIKRKIFLDFLEEGFFSDWRDIRQITEKLSQRGYMIGGRKVGRISQMLTLLCRDSTTGLERNELPKDEWKEHGRWRFKKVR